MGTTPFSLWIGGYPATEIAAHTPPTYETLADGGCGEATFALSLTPRSNHQALVRDALVQIKCCGVPIYTGAMTEPDRTTWQCHAYGLSSSLRRFLALDSGGSNTRDFGAAITEAIADGWQGTNPHPVTGTAAGSTTGNPVKVGDLLDDYAEQTGQRWGADRFGRLYMSPDPTTPQWLAEPGMAAFGVTNEDVATRLAGRFDSGAGYLTAIVGEVGTDEAVDLTDRGTLTLTAAEAILAGMLLRAGGVQWTNGVTLGRDQITTRGGSSAFLPTVRGGQMMRALGLTYGAVSRTPRDVVIGKTRYTVGESTIYVEPVNTAPRSLRSVIAA